MMLNFIEKRSKKPRMTQSQICKQLGTSDSTIKRYRNDIQMDSPYNIGKNKRKSNKSNSTVTQSQSTTKKESTKNKKRNKKSDLKICFRKQSRRKY